MPTTNYPEAYIEQIILRDGTPVTLRPVRPDEAPRLQEGFARLTPQTIYMRFLEIFKELSDDQAHTFANVDYYSHMALVGVTPENGEEHIIVVARYALLDPNEPARAEAAIVVRDDFQNRGLGTIAMGHLVRYARDHGVCEFVGTIHVNNARIMHFINKSELAFKKEMVEPGAWEVTVELETNRTAPLE